MVKALSAVIATAALCSLGAAFPPKEPGDDQMAVGADGETFNSVKAAFRDVAAQSGIDYIQHERTSAPNCIFDEPSGFYHKDVRRYGLVSGTPKEVVPASHVNMILNTMAKDVGGFCFPERNCGGAASADLNGDGLVDLVVTSVSNSARLYMNLGGLEFEDRTESAGLVLDPKEGQRTCGVNLVDIDNDGDTDILFTTIGGSRHLLFVNDGHGSFTEDAIARGFAVTKPEDTSKTSGTGIAVGDYDNDGYLDIFVGEWRPYYLRDIPNVHKGRKSNSRLLRNLGKAKPGFFEDVTDKAGLDIAAITSKKILRDVVRSMIVPDGIFTFGAAFTDLDNDGYQDLFIASDFGTGMLFWNNGDGTFIEGSTDAGVGVDENGMGLTLADYDGDGLIDVYVTAIYDDREYNDISPFGTKGNFLYKNLGNRKFEIVCRDGILDNLGWGWGAAFLDYDNDGRLDIAATNGMSFPETTEDDPWNITPDRLYVQRGEGADLTWDDKGPELGFLDDDEGRAVVVADFDNDGYQDIFVVKHAGKAMLYENYGTHDNAFLRVFVHEPSGRASVGARVTLHRTDGSMEMREIISTSNFLGQSEYVAHFGLGNAAPAELAHIDVLWPHTGQTMRVTGASLLMTSPGKTGGAMLKVTRPKSDPRTEVTAESVLLDLPVSRRKGFDKVMAHARSTQDKQLAADASEVAALDAAAKSARADLPPALRELFDTIVSKGAPAKPRSLSGDGNNAENKAWGKAGAPLIRKTPPGYDDGISSPAGPFRPSARLVSNEIFDQKHSIESERRLNDMFSHFGQLLAHDTGHTTPQPNTRLSENIAIKVPKGDPHFDAAGNGGQLLRVRRSIFDASTGSSATSPRQQMNKVTSFVDASVVYGSDNERCEVLREHRMGLLRTTSGNHLPFNTKGLPNDNPLNMLIRSLWLAGDARVNIQPGLAAMHTVWHREHNWLARQLYLAGLESGKYAGVSEDDGTMDEEIFAMARQLLVAEYQHVVYNEYLPALLGRAISPPYKGYDASVNPTARNEFQVAAFRYGHSQANDVVFRAVHEDTGSGRKRVMIESKNMHESYFQTQRLIREGGVDPVVRGITTQVAQAIDSHAADSVRNFLFGPRQVAASAHGLDLVATNIQRGRDHGIPDYNTVRTSYGLPPRESFSDITSNASRASKLEMLYGSVDDLDLFVAGLCEDKVAGSLGETFARIVEDQFVAMRDGDSHWFEATLDEKSAESVRKHSGFADILTRNVPGFEHEGDIFFAPNEGSQESWLSSLFGR